MRYEGILSEVDPVQKTMRLKNVKNCGTEGRRGGQNEIQESEQEIQEVLFKIEHIKDFKILEKPNTVLLDPAIVQSSTNNNPPPVNKEQPKPQNAKPAEEIKTL
jgi:Scd6-like Sm domain